MCCDSAECWIESKADSWKKPYRFLKLEGTAISEEIELQVSANNYELSPPGTSSTAQPFHFLIRSRRWNQDPKRPLKTLCVEISSNGIIRKGSWNGNQNQCGFLLTLLMSLFQLFYVNDITLVSKEL